MIKVKPPPMLDAQATQFSLSDDGQILWQESANNPLPGVPVAKLSKGAAALAPVVELLDVDVVKALDATAVQAKVEGWLKDRITSVLEPLVALADAKADAGPVEAISQKIYESLGVIPRGEIEEFIGQLDTDTRRDVRAKKIKLGPVLVFIPALNKPAAVRLKGLLWSLYEGKALPANVPPDGVVSLKIEDDAADHNFYRAIGYPIYGGRAIRIDMLDRVICAVYDHAVGGKFQARHEMAEWFGSSIEDLYKVLEAMGHKKISDPAEEKEETVAEEEPKAEVEKAEEKTEEKPEEKKADVKPELATFRLKKGKASEDKKAARKPFKKPDAQKDKKPFKKSDKKKHEKKDRGPRVIEALAAPDDSPFAILKQLQKK